ncbi:hypothetical protein J6W34_09600 [bacterium]|nr:hypothetical protein [bacterium]
MEKDISEKIADQKEVIRDLQDRLVKATDDNEKQSLQLKLDVANAKLKEIEFEKGNETSTSEPANEGVSQNTKIFHNAITDGEYSDQLDEAKMTWKEQRANELRQRIKRAMVQRDRAGGDAKRKWQEGINDMRRQLKKVLSEEFEDEKEEELKESMPNGYSKSKFLKEMKDAVKEIKQIVDKANSFIDKENINDIRLIFKSVKGYAEMIENNCQDILDQEKKGVLKEGCMTKKFENMTNREVASYIFSHPHTKFAGKMKECDDKEILKAIRDMKKEMSEEAPVTNTSAVASAPKPSMYLKRPEQEELKDNQ